MTPTAEYVDIPVELIGTLILAFMCYPSLHFSENRWPATHLKSKSLTLNLLIFTPFKEAHRQGRPYKYQRADYTLSLE